MGYTKNIAVIKQLKQGFSADGGGLSGLVKAEKYGASLRVEVTLINFAPLSEGRYVTAVSDGSRCEIVENGLYEGKSELNTANGFAALVCYVNKQVSPVAAAICGNFQGAALSLKAEVERIEKIKSDGARPAAANDGYEDEAIAEENYYEYAKTDKNGDSVCEDSQKEEDGNGACQNEAAACACEEKPRSVKCERKEDEENSGKSQNPLSRGGDFYNRMKGEIEGILNTYPAEEELCKIVDGSKWVRISFGGNKYYVFGIIYGGGVPKYICYGVPAQNGERAPESMAGMAGFIPCKSAESGGYWVLYQDAATGASLKIQVE